MTAAVEAPEVGELVRVRGQQWVVARCSVSTQPRDELAASQPPGRTLVTLTSVSDDDLGEELTLAWEVEPGRKVLPETQLPQVTETGWDDPETLGAFLDAVRWGTVASADPATADASGESVSFNLAAPPELVEALNDTRGMVRYQLLDRKRVV